VVLATDPALPFPQGFDEELTAAARDDAQDYLDGVAERLRNDGVRATAVAALGGSPAETVLDASKAPGVRMVALATHGRGGVRRLVLGSVADKLIRGAERPVLVVRPTGKTRRS
jgi:nucleotide-binding universal stress UspA family protein